jgi:D-sedoheptulose 7-phosphate isomerase
VNYERLIVSNDAVVRLTRLAESLKTHKKEGKRILFFGNGASASIASHASLDFTKQAGIRSLCFHDPALLTAFSNDYGYDNCFSKIFDAYSQPDDYVFLISTSGESPNIIKVAENAISKGLFVVAFTGRSENNSVSKLASESFWVDSHAYNIVENTHSIWITTLIDYVIGRAEYEVS